MKTIFFLLIMAALFDSKAQQFEAVYKSSFMLPDSLINVPNLAAEAKRNHMDSNLMRQLFNEMLAEEFSTRLQRKVRVNKDTTFIEMVPNRSSSFLKIKVNHKNTVLFKGDFLEKDSKGKFYPKKMPAEEMVKTNLSEKILNYPCVIYVNKSKTLKIWLAKELPTSLNPGINGLAHLDGAVLKFIRKDKTADEMAEIISLQKKPLN